MSKHTPGPWSFSQHDIGAFIRCNQGYLIAGPINERPGHQANASLIAAAPDLLEALQSVVDWMDEPVFYAFSDEQVANCKKAIAKATGDTP